MKRRRFLPPYVTVFTDRHGKDRLRFRRKGFQSHYFAAAFGTPAFGEEYHLCMTADAAASPAGAIAAAIERTVPGSLGDLTTRYLAVPDRLGPTATTQAKVRSIVDSFRQGRMTWPVATLTFEHIDAIIAAKRQKILGGKRPSGGIEAARKLRKELIRLFDFAVKIGLRPDNPVRQSERVKAARGERSKGYHTWTEPEIEQYRQHHKLGTRPRLAMELMLWTCQRRIDAIHLGRQHIRNGRFELRQTKTGSDMELLLAPQLLEAIVAMPRRNDHLVFLVNDKGRPFSNAGFGNWFRDQCDAAGLPQCTAHGLRKAMMRRTAELNFSNQSLKSLSGHKGDNEVADYTRAVDQRRLSDTAIRAVAEWECLTSTPRLDTKTPENG